MATIESIALDGGECAGKYSINDMKAKGWSVDDIELEWKKQQYLCAPKTESIDLWCNGSTTDFGSVCLGSNPGRSTRG